MSEERGFTKHRTWASYGVAVFCLLLIASAGDVRAQGQRGATGEEPEVGRVTADDSARTVVVPWVGPDAEEEGPMGPRGGRTDDPAWDLIDSLSAWQLLKEGEHLAVELDQGGVGESTQLRAIGETEEIHAFDGSGIVFHPSTREIGDAIVGHLVRFITALAAPELHRVEQPQFHATYAYDRRNMYSFHQLAPYS